MTFENFNPDIIKSSLEDEKAGSVKDVFIFSPIFETVEEAVQVGIGSFLIRNFWYCPSVRSRTIWKTTSISKCIRCCYAAYCCNSSVKITYLVKKSSSYSTVIWFLLWHSCNSLY